MSRIAANDLLQQLQWRYAVKKFDSNKKISEQDWKALRTSLVLSPSSYGLQPWKFLIIDSPQVRKQLTAASWNQTQVADSSHYVVLTAVKSLAEADIDRYINRVAEVRKVDRDSLKMYRDMMVGDLIKGPRNQMITQWAAMQTYIALGNLLTSAALLGIDSCPMEGLDPVKYDEILGLKGSNYATLCACALGYRSSDDKYALAAKVRFPEETMLQHI